MFKKLSTISGVTSSSPRNNAISVKCIEKCSCFRMNVFMSRKLNSHALNSGDYGGWKINVTHLFSSILLNSASANRPW